MFHEKHPDAVTTTDRIAGFARVLGVTLPDPAPRKLAAFAAALSGRGVALGVVSRSDGPRAQDRHVLDSLRAVRALLPTDRTAHDLGSGGGLPGIPVAIAVPELGVTLVEGRRLRAAWLELLVQELAIPNAAVARGRIEDVSQPADVCFARALGTLEESWSLARPLLRSGGRLVYFGGAGFDPASSPLREEIRILDEPGLETPGPLAIIARQ